MTEKSQKMYRFKIIENFKIFTNIWTSNSQKQKKKMLIIAVFFVLTAGFL